MQQQTKDTSLDIQPLIQFSTSTNSGEQSSSFENQLNFKYQKEVDDDQLIANDDESNEQQTGQIMLNNGRSSPTAEQLKWPLDNDEQKNHDDNKQKVDLKRSTVALKNHKIRKHRKAKRSVVDDLNNVDSNKQFENKTSISQFNKQNLTNLKNMLGNERPQNDQTNNNNNDSLNSELQNFITINWEPPLDARGTIVGYNITLDGMTRFMNEDNKQITERFKLIYEIRSNITNEFTIRVNPNTRYQVRMCAVNKVGCGKLSSFSLNSQCDSQPTINKSRFQNLQATLSRRITMINNFPHISPASQTNYDQEFNNALNSKENSNSNNKNPNIQLSKNNQLVLNLPRLNERDGRILCYRIVMIRLPKYEQLMNQFDLFVNQRNLNLTLNNQQQQGNSLANASLNKKIDELKFNNSELLESSLKVNNSYRVDLANLQIKFQQQFDILSILPSDTMQLPVYRYEQLNNVNYSTFNSNQLNLSRKSQDNANKLFSKNTVYFTYLAKEMSSNQFQNEIVIGDKTESSCSAECIPNDISQYSSSNNQKFLHESHNSSSLSSVSSFYALAQRDSKVESNSPVASARSTIGRRCVFNGELESNTNYTGFVEIHVSGVNNSRLVQRSNYFKPISTGFQSHLTTTTTTTFKTSTQFTNHLGKLNSLFSTISDNTAAIVFGTIAGTTLLLLLFLCFILCCLKRKTSNRNSNSPTENKKGVKCKIKQKKKSKISHQKDQNRLTDLDKSFSEEQISDEQVKLSENEIVNHNSSPKNSSIKCLDCETDYTDCNLNNNNNNMNSMNNNSILNRQSNVCTYSCLENQIQLNLETNNTNQSWVDDESNLPLPPPTDQTVITHQQMSSFEQQPAILIDTNTHQTILSTNDQIQLLHHLKQSNNLPNLYETCLTTSNLINNHHLNYDNKNFNNTLNSNYSILPNLNNLNYNHQQSIDNESTTNSLNNSINTSINNSSLNDNESEILTAHRWISAEFPMKNIHEVFLEKHDNDDQIFQIEFNLIPVNFNDRTFNHCTNSMNKAKNRDQNIKCFDQNRVKLNCKTVSFAQTISTMPRQSSTNSTSSSSNNGGSGGFSTLSRTLRRKKNKTTTNSETNDTSSNNSSSTKKQDSNSTSNSPSILSNNSQQQQQTNDYIHANYVQLNDMPYIITQSPLENTISHFWQMIIEQNINIIVALCDLDEDGSQTCLAYWNESNTDNGLKQVSNLVIN